MLQDGFLFIWIDNFMKKIFGVSWRTSFYGILAIAPQAAPYVTNYLNTMSIPKHYLDLVSLVFGILTVLNMKDKQVTGTK